jgi:hypothetical protein
VYNPFSLYFGGVIINVARLSGRECFIETHAHSVNDLKVILRSGLNIFIKHNCGVETCRYFGLMVKQGSFLCEQQIRFDSDKNAWEAQLKSERLKRDRKNRKAIIDEGLE